MGKTKRPSNKAAGTKQKRPRRSESAEEPPVNYRDQMVTAMAEIGFDGNFFADMLEQSTTDRKKRGKPPRKNRYFHYCSWAHALMRNEVGPEDSEYAFPAEVLNYIRELVPGDVKGEIREDAFKVTLADFCRVMEIRRVEDA